MPTDLLEIHGSWEKSLPLGGRNMLLQESENLQRSDYIKELKNK